MTTDDWKKASCSAWLQGCHLDSVYARNEKASIVLAIYAQSKENYFDGLERAGQEIARRIPGAHTFGLTSIMDRCDQLFLMTSVLHLQSKRAESEFWRVVGRDLVFDSRLDQQAPALDSLLKGYALAILGVTREIDCKITELP